MIENKKIKSKKITINRYLNATPQYIAYMYQSELIVIVQNIDRY